MSLPGTFDIEWPHLVQEIECPLCTSAMTIPPRKWTRCPNEDCQVEIILLISGLYRERPRI